MLGRGVKRKWGCLEESEAETLPAAVTEQEKEDGEENENGILLGPSTSAMSRLQQRQLVLGLCLEKLQHYQAGMELSLRRSVLLINTLRQIQDDMQSDDGAMDVPLEGIHPDSIREDIVVTCPGCTDGGGESPSLPSIPAFTSQEANTLLGQPKSLPSTMLNAFSDAVNAMGDLSDVALDNIFEDIDTSMYETSELPAVWAAGSLWPVNVSFWADEEVKMCTAGHAAAGSLQSCLMDLNELDHIMEILVKS
ncbi:SERTA domain-containing protein 2 [Genypterus blacodes]|uniref:SERTA domain-containing protein 2 n=1 Tax=Genypterus blacodes TaxID=154954 RepID=UPI003F773F13